MHLFSSSNPGGKYVLITNMRLKPRCTLKPIPYVIYMGLPKQEEGVAVGVVELIDWPP